MGANVRKRQGCTLEDDRPPSPSGSTETTAAAATAMAGLPTTGLRPPRQPPAERKRDGRSAQGCPAAAEADAVSLCDTRAPRGESSAPFPGRPAACRSPEPTRRARKRRRRALCAPVAGRHAAGRRRRSADAALQRRLRHTHVQRPWWSWWGPRSPGVAAHEDPGDARARLAETCARLRARGFPVRARAPNSESRVF